MAKSTAFGEELCFHILPKKGKVPVLCRLRGAPRDKLGHDVRPLWVSVDPRTSHIQAYKESEGEQIEHAYQTWKCQARVPRLGANIWFDVCGAESHQQYTRTGARDVLRVLVPTTRQELDVWVVFVGHSWRLAHHVATTKPYVRKLSLVNPPKIGDKVIWVSVGPKGKESQIRMYPGWAAKFLETAYQRSVPTVNFGEDFHHAIVEFNVSPGRHVQHTPAGTRDVVRVDLSDWRDGEDITLLVFHSGIFGWRLAHPSASDGVPVSFPVDPENIVFTGNAEKQSQVQSLCILAPESKPPEFSRAVWQWCRVCCGESDAEQLPTGSWCVYSQIQNDAIEDAYQARCAFKSVTVGCRDFSIVFQTTEVSRYAHQTDKSRDRSRLVRRIVVSLPEYEMAFRFEPPQIPNNQKSCEICSKGFVDTASMPILVTRCQHAFHQACVRPLADIRSPCPRCKIQTNWATAKKIDPVPVKF